MRCKRVLAGLLLAALAWCLPAVAAEPVPMRTAWLGEHETFAVWYAKEKGWDKEEGLDLILLHFDSGKSVVEGMLAYKWAVAGCGAVPALTAALSDRLDIIAVANDESAANALYVRPDSPILKVKGATPGYPEVYGDADSVRGKTIVCTKGTSAHYLMASWLKILGLTEKDVKIKYMEPTPALGGFVSGLGDVVALWAPLTYEAANKGFKPAALSSDCGVSQPIVLVANREFAQKNPHQIEAFLRMYMRALKVVHETAPEALAPDYVRFYEEWTKRTLTTEEAVQDLKSHPVFSLDEQLALFDTSNGRSQLQNWLLNIADFYTGIGTIRPSERQRLERLNEVTDVYLKAVRKSMD